MIIKKKEKKKQPVASVASHALTIPYSHCRGKCLKWSHLAGSCGVCDAVWESLRKRDQPESFEKHVSKSNRRSRVVHQEGEEGGRKGGGKGGARERLCATFVLVPVQILPYPVSVYVLIVATNRDGNLLSVLVLVLAVASKL